MSEVDDRLAGDPTWELFPSSVSGAASAPSLPRRLRRWFGLAVLVPAVWLVYPPAAVVVACVLVASHDLRAGRQLARSIPDKAGGSICARFTYAWGAWKVGLTAFLLMVLTVTVSAAMGVRREVPPAFVAAMFLSIGGFAASAALTASGLLKAYRSGMRVWIGQGVNQARTLLMAMLITAFTVGVLGPACLWLAGRFPRVAESRGSDYPILLGFFGCLVGGPVVILIVLDWFSRRVVADRPGKFGPKVPTVGKWNA